MEGDILSLVCLSVYSGKDQTVRAGQEGGQSSLRPDFPSTPTILGKTGWGKCIVLIVFSAWRFSTLKTFENKLY